MSESQRFPSAASLANAARPRGKAETSLVSAWAVQKIWSTEFNSGRGRFPFPHGDLLSESVDFEARCRVDCERRL